VAWGWFCAGLGHGTYIPLYFSVAPINLLDEFLLHNFWVMFYLAPLLWALIYGWTASERTRPFAAVLLVTGYVAAVASIWRTGDNLTYIARTYSGMAPVLIGGAIVYLAGQVWLWRQILRRSPVA
jgi:hypothetical protein